MLTRHSIAGAAAAPAGVPLYTEEALRPFICDSDYLAKMQLLQESIQTIAALPGEFVKKIDGIIACLNFIKTYYSDETRASSILKPELRGPGNNAYQAVIKESLGRLPSATSVKARQRQQSILLDIFNSGLIDILHNDCISLLRHMAMLIHALPRAQREVFTEYLPWGGNSWYQLEFLGAIFTDLKVIGDAEPDLVSIYFYDFDGDKEKQAQLIEFKRAICNEVHVIRSALYDIIHTDFEELNRFFMWIKAQQTSSPMHAGAAPKIALRHLTALIWHCKDTRHLYRSVNLMPAKTISAKELMKLPGYVQSNLDLPIDLKSLIKELKIPEQLEQIVYNLYVCNLGPTPTMHELMEFEKSNFSPSARAASARSAGKSDEFAMIDLISKIATRSDGADLAPMLRRLSSAGRDIDLSTNKGRYAALRRMQMVGETLADRNISKQLRQAPIEIDFNFLESVRNILTHQDQYSRDHLVARIENDPEILRLIYKEYFFAKQQLFELIAWQQSEFPKILSTSDDTTPPYYGRGAEIGAFYWSTIKERYAETPILLMSKAEIDASLALITNVDEQNRWRKILQGLEEVPNKKMRNLKYEFFSSREDWKIFVTTLDEAIARREAARKNNADLRRDLMNKKKKMTQDNMSFLTIYYQQDQDSQSQGEVNYIPYERMIALARTRFNNLIELLKEALNLTSLKEVAATQQLRKELARDPALLDAFCYLSGQILILINGLSTHPLFKNYSKLNQYLEQCVQYRNYLEHNNPIIDTNDTPYRTLSKVNHKILGVFMLVLINSGVMTELEELEPKIAGYEKSKCNYREYFIPVDSNGLYGSIILAARIRGITIPYLKIEELREAVCSHLIQNQDEYQERIETIIFSLILDKANKQKLSIRNLKFAKAIEQVATTYAALIARENELNELKAQLTENIARIKSYKNIDSFLFNALLEQHHIDMININSELNSIDIKKSQCLQRHSSAQWFSLYLEELKTYYAWANELEVEILAKILNINIRVYSDNVSTAPEHTIQHACEYTRRQAKIGLCYSYHQEAPKSIYLLHTREEHYTVLEALLPALRQCDELATNMRLYATLFAKPETAKPTKQAEAFMPTN